MPQQPNTPEIRSWAKVLRSGRYVQGPFALRLGNRFDALGVACDLFSPSRWRLVSDVANLYSYDGHTGILPPEVATHYGLPATPKVVWDDRLRDLCDLNDDGVSFCDLADAIEATF